MLIRFATIFILLLSSWRAYASPGKEFMMSCTYGVLAGTLVGAATLAFESQPGDKLYKVARGASLGLYAGIALGLYVVYGVSDDEDLDYYNTPGLPPPERRSKRLRESRLLWAVSPVFNNERPVAGAMTQLQFRF